MWEPILDGRLADRGWQLVHEIAAELPIELPAAPEDAALLWAYVCGAIDEPVYGARYEQAMADLVDGIDGRADFSIFGGLSGHGWVIAHVSDGGADEVLDVIDRALVDAVATQWNGECELTAGLAAVALYFLERLAASPSPSARIGIDHVVAHLDRLAKPMEHGVAWLALPVRMSRAQREAWVEGCCDCGVSHGASGIVAVLARIAALPDPPARARPLCEEAIRWLRRQRLPDNPHARFPTRVVGQRAVGIPRNAWCYGDPGIGAALWAASLRIGAPSSEWTELAIEAALRPVDAPPLTDPGLCHGAFGLAHLYNRFYQASRDHRFRDAAREWFARGFAMPRPTEHGFIDGAIGIALAVLAGLGTEEPGWDRRLVCDIPLGAASSP